MKKIIKGIPSIVNCPLCIVNLVMYLLLIHYPLVLSAQQDSGFTDKSEAKNLKVNGKKEGKWVQYLDSNEAVVDTNAKVPAGAIQFYRLVIFKAGKANGIVREYFIDGELSSEVYCIDSKRNGVERDYSWTTGKLVAETPYRNDKMNGISKEYYNNGILAKETPYTDNLENGLEKEYYDNGKLEYETPYKDGKVDGIQKMYWENGKLLEECTCVKDKKNGTQKSYYESGILRRECSYINDTITLKKNYDEKGKLNSLTTYTKGLPVTTKYYDENGNEVK